MLRLYALPTCPFCAMVRDKLNEMNIEFTEFNINEKENEETLLEIGGKRQVPFLVDDNSGINMYESADIIKYIEENIKS